MQSLILALALALIFSPKFRNKAKQFAKKAIEETNKPATKPQLPGEFRDLIDTIKQINDGVQPKTQPKKNKTKQPKVKPALANLPDSIEYERAPIDRLDIPEGGAPMKVQRIQDSMEHHESNPILEDLFGTTDKSRQEQLRRAFILKEIIDRKY